MFAMRYLTILSFVLLVSLLSCKSKSEFYATDGAAIGGYDPVAFFSSQMPVKGNPDYRFEWQNTTWLFSSEENLLAFKASPEKYAPQYGGWCAYGTADGHLSPTQPETWTILNDKLYFNYNMEVKALWVKDQSGYIRTADENWPQLKGN